MKKHIVKELYLAYLENKFPNKWVVYVNLEEFANSDFLNKAKDILFDLDFSDIEVCDSIIAGWLFLECENEDEAYEIFDMFQEDYSPVTFVWGPIQDVKCNVDMNEESIAFYLREVKFIKELQEMNPHGALLACNLD